MRLRILSWNIHKAIGGVDRAYSLIRVAEVINDLQPDIALLQEVADGWPRAGRDLQGEKQVWIHTGMFPCFRGGAGAYLSRKAEREAMIFGRDSRGSMISST